MFSNNFQLHSLLKGEKNMLKSQAVSYAIADHPNDVVRISLQTNKQTNKGMAEARIC
jgi:hypothetical protein